MLFEQLFLTSDISSVAFGKNVFSHRLYRFARDDFASDSRLYRYLEQLTRYHFFELFGYRSAARIRLFSVDYQTERVADLAVEQQIELDKIALSVSYDLVIKTCVTARTLFQRVEKVVDYLVQRHLVIYLDARAVEISHILEHAPK